MARLRWKQVIREIQKLRRSWETQQALHPYLCDFLVGLALNQQDHFHIRVLTMAIHSAQQDYPQLYQILPCFYRPISERIYVQDMIQHTLSNHLQVPLTYYSTTDQLLLDDPRVPKHYNIIHQEPLPPPSPVAHRESSVV